MDRKLIIILLFAIFFIGLGLTLHTRQIKDTSIPTDSNPTLQQESEVGKVVENVQVIKTNPKIYIRYAYPSKHSDKLVNLYVQYFLDNGATLIKENDTRTIFEFDTPYGKAELKYFYAHGDPCYEEACGNPTFNITVPDEFQYDYYPELPGYSIDYLRN